MAATDPSGRYPPPSSAARTGRTLSVVGFVCAAVALVFFPIVFGPAAVVLGLVASRKGDPLGRWVIAAGVAGLVLGVVLAALAYDAAQMQG